MKRILNILLFACLAGPATSAHGDPSELKSSYPVHDDCGPEFVERFWAHEARFGKSGSVASIRDEERNNIAILEDDGLLVSFVANENFQGFVTNTTNIARRFYATRPDVYDYLVIFVASTFTQDVQTDGGGFAFALNVANDIEGIGLAIFNSGDQVVPGLDTLRAVINMNDLGEYGEDPSEELPAWLNTWSGIDVLGQEAEHMVGAYVSAPGGDILGRGNTHWSYFFESYGSVMEGNGWRDDDDGSFTTIASGSGYSQLDLYLFGLIDVADVTDPMYVIRFPTPPLTETGGDATIPASGVSVFGTRSEITAEGIAMVNGTRVPSAAEAPKSFSMAWVLVIPRGSTPAAHDLEKIDEFRAQWQEFFATESNGIGAMQIQLGAAPVSADFEARVFAGEPGVTVPFDNDSFGNVDSYRWDFGDGHTSSERHPVHTYTDKGIYSVRLTVNGEGGERVAEKTDFVRVGDVTTYFFDDFESDRGWGWDTRDNASTGRWLRANPEPTLVVARIGNATISATVQPDDDHSPAGVQCYVTGNAARGAPLGEADVDNGVTSLVSPVLDLSTATDPLLSFWFWFSNNVGNSPGRDTFTVEVSNNAGASWEIMKTFHSSHHYWREEQLRLSDFVAVTDRMRIRFRARDLGDGSLVEAAVDDVRIFDIDTATPVALQDFVASSGRHGVELSWRLSADVLENVRHVVVQRGATHDGPWQARATLSPAIQMRFEDADVMPGETSWYRVAWARRNGSVETSAPLEVVHARFTRTALTGAYEASDGGVHVRFALAEAANVQLEVYSAKGRRVAVIETSHRPAGQSLIVWEPRDERGRRVPRGIYFVRLTTNGIAHTRKLALVR